MARPAASTLRSQSPHEAWRTGSLAAEISARVVEEAFFGLDAPIARVCSAEVPIPYAKHLEQAALPQPDKIVADNGPELVSQALQHFCEGKVGLSYIPPGMPWNTTPTTP